MLFFPHFVILLLLARQEGLFFDAPRSAIVSKFTTVEVKNMSRVCIVCNKGQNSGNNVSHSHRKTRRTFKANVQKVKIVKEGKVETAYVCARCLKSDKVERA